MKQERTGQGYLYSEYQERFLSIYHDERLEAYYYSFVQEFLRGLCAEGQKVVRVHDNKFRSERGSKIHYRGNYARKDSVPDLLVVPRTYHYENTTRPDISIELKMSDTDIEFSRDKDPKIIRYNGLKWPPIKQKLHNQLKAEFCKTDFMIYTDCVTWHFLKKTGADATSIESDTKCLLNPEGDRWEWTTGKEWEGLKAAIRDFMENSRMKNSDQEQSHAADT